MQGQRRASGWQVSLCDDGVLGKERCDPLGSMCGSVYTQTLNSMKLPGVKESKSDGIRTRWHADGVGHRDGVKSV